MPAPEQPCSPASSHGRLSFRPVIVTTAHVHAVKPFVTVLSWDEAAIYSLNSTDCGNNLFTPGICKTMKTSSIRHLFGLGGWVGGSPPILSLFGFSEMSDNCRPPLTIDHTIACRALLLWCLAEENRGPCVPKKFSLSNCASPGDSFCQVLHHW